MGNLLLELAHQHLLDITDRLVIRYRILSQQKWGWLWGTPTHRVRAWFRRMTVDQGIWLIEVLTGGIRTPASLESSS